MPIYGTRDAGRNFCLKLEEVIKAKGFKLNYILPTLFALRNNEREIVAIVPSNVDDLLYGHLPEAENAVRNIL